MANSSRLRMQAGQGDGYLIVSEHRFGFDSSWVELSRLDAQWNAVHLAAYRFGDPLWFLFDGTYGAGGMVVSGTLTNSYVPQLVRFAYDGSVTWTKAFDGMQFSQTRFAVLLTNGFNGFAYTNADSFGGNGIYRVQFNAETGDDLSVVQVTNANDMYFRVYCGATVDELAQMLGGSGVIAGDHQAFLGRFDYSGSTWQKLYQLGSAEPQLEEIVGVADMFTGSYACAMNSRATQANTDGLFMLVDDDGQPVSGMRLSDPAGVYLTAIQRLYTGDILIAGSTNAGVPMLYKVDDAGAFVWAKRCETCTNAPINSFYIGYPGTLYALGPAQIYEVSAEGDVCGFEPVTSVSVTPFVPDVTDITPVNNTSPAVTVNEAISLLPRTSASAANVLCEATSIDSFHPAEALVAYPNPAGTTLMLDRLQRITPQERIVLLDMRGNVVLDEPYGNGIDVSGLEPGIYVCLVPRTHQRVRVTAMGSGAIR